jgi:hypothetical protein
MQDQVNVFIASLNVMLSQIIAFMPKLMAATMIIIVGCGVAWMARLLTKKILKASQFDRIAEKSGLEAFIRQGDVDLTLTGIISQVVYWLILLLFVITGADALGLQAMATMLQKLASYLPSIILAILVMIFGTLIARFANRLVFSWLYSIKYERALSVSTSVEYLIQLFALFVALEQLGFATQLLTALFVIIFGAIFLALAIAFGLGGRDHAAQIIQDYQRNKK